MRAFSRPVDAAPLSPRPRGHATLRPGRAGRCGAVTPFFPFISGGSEAGAGGVEDEADHEALLAHLAQTRRDDTVGSGIAKLIFDNLTGQAAAKAREAPLLCLQVARQRQRLPRSVCLLFTLPAGARRRGDAGARVGGRRR